MKSALMQLPLRQPDAVAVMHEYLDPRAATVGKEVGVVRSGFTKDGHHVRQQSLHARAHVQGLHTEPQRLDPEHRSHAPSQLAHVLAASVGQLTVSAVSPRRISIWMVGAMLGAMGGADATPTAMNVAAGADNGVGNDALGMAHSRGALPSPRSDIQRRARLALMPCASAMPATEAPGLRHADTTACLNSSL